jgi:outer membrane protein assembly factor BamB
MGTSTRLRAVGAAAAALLLGAGAVVVYRVLAPAEVLTPARNPYPRPAAAAPAGVRGTLPGAPLLVDRRLRVTATTRQVSADNPVTATYPRTPYWSYRRWPAQVTGVLSVRVPAGPRVVTQWSDGALVALDASTGRIAWRLAGPPPGDDGYVGRRTGGATVYTPPGLHLAPTPAGDVLTVAGRSELWGLDPATGRQLWRTRIRGDCRSDAFATTDGHLVARDACERPATVEIRDAATGATVLTGWRPDGVDGGYALEPAGCLNGRSGCAPAMRTVPAGQPTRGWRLDGPRPVPLPALDAPGSVLVDGVTVTPQGDDVIGRALDTGAERWRRSGHTPLRVVAVQAGRVHLLDDANRLLTLDTATGAQRSRFRLSHAGDGVDWAPGLAYAADGFVAVERLTEPVEPSAADTRYYLAARPVVWARTG